MSVTFGGGGFSPVAALDRGRVLDWLRSLPEEEFAHLLAAACRGRAYRHDDTTER